MTHTTNITILHHPKLRRRWWPRVLRYGTPLRRVWEIDWLRLTIVVRR